MSHQPAPKGPATHVVATQENNEEGWAIRLSANRCVIIATDARFSSDEDAEAFVRRQAKEGSELHAYALQLCEP